MMKRLIFLCLLLPATAWSTRARVAALGDSSHLIDEHLIYSNPLVLNYLGSSINLESGTSSVSTSAAQTSSPEASLVLKINEDRRMAFALGHQDNALIDARYLASSLNGSVPLLQNPIDFLYGQKSEDFNFTFGISYSNYRDEIGFTREKSAVIRMGYELGAWQIFGKYALQNQAHYSGKDFEGSGFFNAEIKYFGESVEYFTNYESSNLKVNSSVGDLESDSIQKVSIGFISSAVKEENDVFWGLRINGAKVDCSRRAGAACAGAYTYTKMPFLIGYEARAAAWIVLRASLTQSIFVNQVKDEIGFPANSLPETTGSKIIFDGGPGNTVVAAGLGFTFGKLLIDGLLKGSVNQTLNQTDFINQLGLKYTF